MNVGWELVVFVVCLVVASLATNEHDILERNPWRATIAVKEKNGTLSPVCVGALLSPGQLIAAASCFFRATDGGQLRDIHQYGVVFDKPVVRGVHMLDKNVFPLSRVVRDESLGTNSISTTVAIASLVLCRPTTHVALWQYHNAENADNALYIHTWEDPCTKHNVSKPVGRFMSYWRSEATSGCRGNLLCLNVKAPDWKCHGRRWNSSGGGVVMRAMGTEVDIVGVTVGAQNTTTFRVAQVAKQTDYIRGAVDSDLCTRERHSRKPNSVNHNAGQPRKSLPLMNSPVFLGKKPKNTTKDIYVKNSKDAGATASKIIRQAQVDARAQSMMSKSNQVTNLNAQVSLNNGVLSTSVKKDSGSSSSSNHASSSSPSPPSSSVPLKSNSNHHHHHHNMPSSSHDSTSTSHHRGHRRHHQRKHRHHHHQRRHRHRLHKSRNHGPLSFNVKPGENVLVVTPVPDPARKNTMKQYFKPEDVLIPEDKHLKHDLGTRARKAINWKKLGMTGKERIDYRVLNHAREVNEKVKDAHRKFIRHKSKNLCAGTWCGPPVPDDSTRR